MARTVEMALIEPMEGKTRAQQLARLNEWKKHYLKLGAEKIVIIEMGPGNINAGWIFTIYHKNAAAYGKAVDSYFANPKSTDLITEKWQKTPVLKFNGYSIGFEVDDN